MIPNNVEIYCQNVTPKSYTVVGMQRDSPRFSCKVKWCHFGLKTLWKRQKEECIP